MCPSNKRHVQCLWLLLRLKKKTFSRKCNGGKKKNGILKDARKILKDSFQIKKLFLIVNK